jgi:ABC-2 type transport system ATP-binding protein
MIEARGLSKRYGDKLAVNDLSFTVRPGIVTGFLGPNGAGKSTTMRMILGLDRPTSGQALINGRPYSSVRAPMQLVGALLDAKDVHGGRTARAHLNSLVQSNGLPRHRVDDVLAMTGMTETANRRIKGFSLGMSQRLGIAAAMLGDPEILIFDEPVNGLDPEGILWIRQFMHAMAAEGRTVFVSSHLMSEMENTAEHLVVIGLGKLLADMSTKDFIAANSVGLVRVRTPHVDRMLDALRKAGLQPNVVDGHIDVLGTTTDAVGELAAENRVTLHELYTQRSSLEEAFMEMTRDSVEYHAADATVGSVQ